MDYQEIFSIANRKISSDFPEVIAELRNWIASGSTGGEIDSMIGKYLYELKNTNNAAYVRLESNIEEYLESLKKRGLL